MKFTIIDSASVNRELYDQCIKGDKSATSFSEAWYLDAVCSEWKIITDNYETVFPFCVNSKFGINYIYQPFFNRATGIYGKHKSELADYIDSGILDNYRLWDFYCDQKYFRNCSYKERIHQSLPLTDPYHKISGFYSGKLKRNLRLAAEDRVTVHGSDNLKNFSDQFRKYTGNKISEFNSRSYATLQILSEKCMEKGGLFLEAVYNNEIVAAGLFLINAHSVLYIEGYSSETGRQHRAMHVIFDEVIRRYAGSGLQLDFGGSNQETIARFFHSFGAGDKTYYHVFRNRLPGFVNVVKKLLKK